MSDIGQQFDRARAFLASIPGAADKAIASALNKAAVAGREAGIEGIAERYVVQPSDVREKVKTSSASPEALTSAIVARSGPLALGYFPHAPTLSGTGGRNRPTLRAEIIRGQEKEIPGAFVAPINGKPRVMIRTGRTTSTGRSAMRSVYTVPMASMLGATAVRDSVEQRVVATIEKVLDREIDQALGKP